MDRSSEILPDHQLGSYDRDEELIAAVRQSGRGQVRVYPWSEVAVVLGNGSRPEVELQLPAVITDQVPVLRRRGGGCAVVLDPGNLVVSVALPLPGLCGIKTWFGRISAWLIQALGELGVAGVTQQGISDLTIGELKIGGSCIHRSRDLLYYSTTLLIDPDLDLVERYLQHPPREPDYRAGRSHRHFMGSLSALAGPLQVADLISGLDQKLRECLS
jgi:lipoate-protein ligase A